jgi:hypothetical protein
VGLSGEAFGRQQDSIVLVNRGAAEQPEIANCVDTIDSLSFGTPILTFDGDLLSLFEQQVLALNYADLDENSVDFFVVNAEYVSSGSGLALGLAWPEMLATYPGCMNFVFCVAPILPPDVVNNNHVPGHEVAHILFDSDQPERPVPGSPGHSLTQSNLMYVPYRTGVWGTKRLTPGQNLDARFDSGPGCSGPVLLQQN